MAALLGSVSWSSRVADKAFGVSVASSSPGQTRTADMVVNSHPLYQLSYRGMGAQSAARDSYR